MTKIGKRNFFSFFKKYFFKKYRQEWLSFGIVLFLMVLYAAVTQTFPFQKYYCFGDTQMQILPISTLLADKIKEGSPLFYSRYLGMGGNTTISFWFHAMSPFVLLYLFMSAEWAACISLILKLAFSALCFARFCRVCLRREGVETVLFSVAYGMCGYAFAYKDSMMLDALYFLPLILVLIDRCVKKKKALALCIGYVFLFLSNFYIAFLVGLTSFIYLLVIHIICNRFQLKSKEKLRVFIHYVYAAGTALCISMFFVLPAVIYEFTVQSGIENKFAYQIPKVWEVFASLMFGVKYAMGVHIPYLYCGILTLLIFPFYFINRQISKREKLIAGISLVILTLCIFVSPLYRLIHLLNYPNGLTMRFSYLLIFLMLSLAVRQWKYMRQIDFKYSILLGIGFLFVYILNPILNKTTGDLKTQIGTILCFVVYLSLLKLLQKYNNGKQEKLALLLILIAVMTELTANGWFMCRVEDTCAEVKENTETIERLLKEEAPDWSRTKIIGGLNQNQALVSHYYEMDAYTSGLNRKESEALGRLGLVTNDTTVTGFGLNKATRMLFGVKYQMDLLKDTPTLEICENTLPIGYMIAGEPDKLLDKDAIVNLNNTLTAFTGDKADIFEIYDGEITYDNSGIMLGVDENDRIVLVRDEKVRGNAWVSFSAPLKNHDGAYLYWNTDLNECIINGPFVSVGSHKDIGYTYYGSLTQERIYKMEESPEGYEIYIIMLEGDMDRFVLNRMQFAYLNEEKLQKAYENLSAFVMEVSEFRDGYIKGNVTATEDKRFLFLSVPYEPGWSVSVDGEKASCIGLLDSAFLGVQLAPGEHEIEFIYHAPGSDLGRNISILGCVLLLSYILYIIVLQSLLQNYKKK